MNVYLCNGKACRKKTAAYQDLKNQLEACAVVQDVGCQKCCSGPVVGIEFRGKVEWFSKLRGNKPQREVLRAVRDGKPSKRLAKRREKKRSGKLR